MVLRDPKKASSARTFLKTRPRASLGPPIFAGWRGYRTSSNWRNEPPMMLMMLAPLAVWARCDHFWVFREGTSENRSSTESLTAPRLPLHAAALPVPGRSPLHPTLPPWSKAEPVSRALALQEVAPLPPTPPARASSDLPLWTPFQNRFKNRMRSNSEATWHGGILKDSGGPQNPKNLHHGHGPF